MALYPVAPVDPYIDDSEFENFDGHPVERHVPGRKHALLQRRVCDLLQPFAAARGGEVLQEWSVGDGAGHWLTPDVTFSFPEFTLTSREHVKAPVFLVVEIRSQDQSMRELLEKRDKYCAWAVPHYWLIDPVEKACYEILPELVVGGQKLRAAEIEIDITQIFEDL